MIEPTDEMLDEMAAVHEKTRRAYWTALGHDTGEGGMTAAEHERVAQRQAMAAVLKVVERDLSAGWLIWSNEHQMWWKSGRAGYTADMMCAGRYELEAALAEMNTRKTATGLPGEVVVRAPHVSLIGNRDLAGMMRAATAEATRQAMAS